DYMWTSLGTHFVSLVLSTVLILAFVYTALRRFAPTEEQLDAYEEWKKGEKERKLREKEIMKHGCKKKPARGDQENDDSNLPRIQVTQPSLDEEKEEGKKEEEEEEYEEEEEEDETIGKGEKDEVTISRTALPRGVKNLGSTCYIGTALQALHSLKDVRRAVQVCCDGTPQSDDTDFMRLIRSVNDIFEEMEHTWSTPIEDPIKPNHLIEILRTMRSEFSNESECSAFSQHDTNDFLLLVLQGLEEKLSTIGRDSKEFFTVQLQSTLSESGEERVRTDIDNQ
ncbi:hypothetical protein PMAYCL1PPCAC_10464, partial [Pristionchus mayeri]